MVTLEKFYPLVSGRLPDVPDPILDEAIRDSCIEFAKQARLFVDAISVKVKAGNRFADIEGRDGTLFLVEKVWRNANDVLEPTTRAEVEAEDWDIISSTPTRYYMEGDGRLALAPVPEVAETLSARVLIRPADDASEVEDVFWNTWRLAVAAGARAYIRINHAPWADSALAAEDSMIFEHAVGKAIGQRSRGGTTTRRPRVMGHYF